MKILVTGAAGQVGRAICTALRDSLQHTLVALARADLDISDLTWVMKVIEQHQPDVLVNAAAYTAVDKAEQETELAFAINALGCENLAKACAQWDIPLLHFSTDYVFDGDKALAYDEADAAAPQGVYGLSKWQGEQAIRAIWAKHFIVRVSWVFGLDGANFVKTILRLAKERAELRIVADQSGMPTSAASIAECVCALLPFALAQQHFGTYHYTNQGATTWYDFAQTIVEQARVFTPLSVQTITAIATTDYPTPAKRPANSALNCQKIQQTFGLSLKPWRAELHAVLSTLLSTES